MVTLEVRQLIFEQVVLLIATGFGLGSLPWVPGTFGSLLGIPLAWWLWGQALTRQLLVITALLAVGGGGHAGATPGLSRRIRIFRKGYHKEVR